MYYAFYYFLLFFVSYFHSYTLIKSIRTSVNDRKNKNIFDFLIKNKMHKDTHLSNSMCRFLKVSLI